MAESLADAAGKILEALLDAARDELIVQLAKYVPAATPQAPPNTGPTVRGGAG